MRHSVLHSFQENAQIWQRAVPAVELLGPRVAHMSTGQSLHCSSMYGLREMSQLMPDADETKSSEKTVLNIPVGALCSVQPSGRGPSFTR